MERDEKSTTRLFEREPVIQVGILSTPVIRFRLEGMYRDTLHGHPVVGNQEISLSDFTKERSFIPVDPSCFFELFDVVIGKGFHWERKEKQRFSGELRIIRENDTLTAVNVVGIETYLESVISSEMNAGSPLEALKAHAVISRSWLLSQVLNKGKEQSSPDFIQTEQELIRWFDREEHDRYDVCADDHCQRYQGMTKASRPDVARAVRATAGQVLTNESEICDARYSKCCGGVTESFETAWEQKHHPYLVPVRDNATDTEIPDLTTDAGARAWIGSSPDSFCNNSDKNLLSAILNGYDRETADFYRWEVRYTQRKLSVLITNRIGIDFGTVQSLIPLERGASGRIIRLEIVGDKRTMVIGKELVIRRALSPSHLYSSAFVVDTEEADGETVFILRGAGWGHGVGLCQIGAAVMASQGYEYQNILSHYYPGAALENIY